MDKKLRSLFDFQRFQPNPRLEKMIEETRSRYGMVSESDLELVNAAGDIHAQHGGKKLEEDE